MMQHLHMLLALAAVTICVGCESMPDPNTAAQHDVVLRVGQHETTVADFDEFAEKLSGEMALLGEGREAARQQVLNTLLARELLLLEGEARDLHRSEQISQTLNDLEQQLTVDALYKSEVTDRTAPSYQQLDSLYSARAHGDAVRASHILCASREDARDILDSLAAGEAFANLARRHSTHSLSATAGGDMGWVRREQLLPEFRGPVWSALPGTVLPDPIRTHMGYHVIRVTDHRQRTRTEMDAELRGEVRRELRRGRESELSAQLRTRYGYSWSAATAAALRAGTISHATAPDSALARWSNGRLTVQQFVQHARKHGLRETEMDTVVARDLGDRAALRGLLWTLAQERGLPGSGPQVTRAVRQRKQQLLADALFSQVAQSVDVSEPALRSAFGEAPNLYRRPPNMRVQEILVDERHLADSLAALVRGGADMAALADAHTQRVWARSKGGDIGVINEANPAYAKLARVARHAPLGQILGPVPSHGGYSVLRVTERTEAAPASFTEAQGAVAQHLRNTAMDALLDSLQARYDDDIHVDQEVLQTTLSKVQ
jgi:peptidyl-prolyl cis-trans isomerase C